MGERPLKRENVMHLVCSRNHGAKEAVCGMRRYGVKGKEHFRSKHIQVMPIDDPSMMKSTTWNSISMRKDRDQAEWFFDTGVTCTILDGGKGRRDNTIIRCEGGKK